MKKFLLIIPLLIWVACEDSSKDDSSSIYGLWEWRYNYDGPSGNWVDFPGYEWWSKLSAENYSERFLFYANSDSSCFSDWSIIDDSSGIYSASWDIFGEDSAAITLYMDDGVIAAVASFKAYDDTLIRYVIITGDEKRMELKAIRVESYDFTPICE